MLLEARAGIEPTYGDLQSHRGYGGPSRNRTDVHGFAVRCIATLPSGRRGPCVYRATKATARPPTGPRPKLDLENEQKVPGTSTTLADWWWGCRVWWRCNADSVLAAAG